MSGNNVQKNFVGDIRQCNKCGEKYVVTAVMVENRRYPCKPCDVERAALWTRKNREKKRILNNAYMSRNSSNRSIRTAAWRANHPEKVSAHQAVQSAIRNGSLSKQPCSVCNAPKAHAHHDNYSLPLSVLWLCHDHHMERHAMLRARGEQ